MKTRNAHIVKANLRLLLILPAIILLLVALSSCAAGKKTATTKTEIVPPQPPEPPSPPPAPPQRPATGQKEGDAYLVVDEMPVYVGGDEALLKYIAVNSRYPKEAKEKNIQGKVIVRFKVTEDGTVADASVLRSIDPLLDTEALRVVGSLPKFAPGKLNGVPVPVWYMVPITFTLNSDGISRSQRYQVTGNDTIYFQAKEGPKFPGGNEALQKFKAENVKYPKKMKNLGIEGMVAVRFNIEKNGSVSDIRILRGTSPAIDAEAIRVTRLMPAWQPGKENGKPVKCMNMINYDFLLTPRVPPVHEEGTPYVVVEEMPLFPGGDSSLLAFISKNTKYPDAAKANNIQGKVIARFCVTEAGGVDRISILKGVDPELDAEAVRVINKLPEFKPGKQGGKPVPVWYMVPITFALDKPGTENVKNVPPNAPPLPQGYDETPVFKGGEKAMYKFINSKLTYPVSAKEKKISGKVIISFCVNTTGVIEQVKVIKKIDPDLDAEAERVFKLLPAWKPGKLAGKPVAVWYNMPVIFTLK
jgi:TonB family protein